VLYLANPCGNEEITAAMAAGVIGFIDTPRQGNRRPPGVLWCADNGCFSQRWEPAEWWSFLEENAADAATCLFATAPDVVGDAVATEERAKPWLARIRDLGYPVAYVAQNGMEFSSCDLWDEIDCLFIGGTTEWKLGPEACNLAAVASSMGKWIHVGRVNSERRFRYAQAIRADSCDGTYLTYGLSKNLTNVLCLGADQPAARSLRGAAAVATDARPRRRPAPGASLSPDRAARTVLSFQRPSTDSAASTMEPVSMPWSR
jgi:hypothetical protein